MKNISYYLFILGCLFSIGLLQAQQSYSVNAAPKEPQASQYCPCGCGCRAPCYCGCTQGKPCTCHSR